MRRSGFRSAALALLAAYAVQFVFGMAANLFVSVPTSHPGSKGTNYFSQSAISLLWSLGFGGGVVLFIHALLACLLVLGALAFFAATLTYSGRGWRWSAGVALFFTIGAFFNGMSFLDFGLDVSSAIMAGCWLIAVGTFVAALVRPGLSSR